MNSAIWLLGVPSLLVLAGLLGPMPPSYSTISTPHKEDVVSPMGSAVLNILGFFDSTQLPPAENPAPRVEAMVQPPTPLPITQSIVRGVVESDDTIIVLIEHRGTLRPLNIGDAFLDYTLVSLDNGTATFAQGETTIALPLPDGALQ